MLKNKMRTMLMFRAKGLFVLVLIVHSAIGQPHFRSGQDPGPSGSRWVKVDQLSDEFEGDRVDASKWQIEPEANGWKWIGRPPGLFKSENVAVKSGKLCVTVSKLEKDTTIDEKNFIYQGGIVRAINPGKVGYYFECRMKANATEMSSTFWLMSRYDCHKKQELDIQECVGRTSALTEDWGKNWDQIFHSNVIHRPTECVEKLQLQDHVVTETKNYEQYYVYAAWWKSPEEIQFYLDGKYQYAIYPKIEWDMPAWLHMAIETYSWNPVPDDGGMVVKGNWDQRTTKYDWIRTWKLVPDVD